MKSAEAPRELSAEEACYRSDVGKLGISSSTGVEPSAAMGDSRGEEALRLALNLDGPGYHAFVCGLEGPDRLERMAAMAGPMILRDEALWDWVYVANFEDPNRPHALRLAAGDASRLRSELGELLSKLREDLPRAFHEDAFESEKHRVVKAYEERGKEQQAALEALASKAGFQILFAPQGNIALIPVVDGKPIENEQQYLDLGPERTAELEKARERVATELRKHLEQQRGQHDQLDEEVATIERQFAAQIVEARVGALAQRFDVPELSRYLEQLAQHVLDHLDPFRGEAAAPKSPFSFMVSEEADPFAIYAVNRVVDNAHTEGPPVIVVDSPTYKNLFGLIERTVDRTGRVTTDFRRIEAGALLEADGGVVVIEAEDVLIEPFVWRVLRRALRSGRVEIEAYDPFVGFTPAALRPDPIQVKTKVVLVGPRWLFELLLANDVEFRDLFKVLADFSPVVDLDDGSIRDVCGRIAATAEKEGLPPFEADALDALVELAVREAADRRKIHLGSERVLDAAREAGARVRSAGLSHVDREQVRQAVHEREHRLDRVEEHIRESISRGQLLVDVEGESVGQVNALAVLELGGHAFGRPSRVTSAVGIGSEGVVSIDRETQLTGPTHDKGVLILESFLRDRFAHSRPLSLRASVVFEQSYGPLEGDSASLAELVAILSRIGEFALRQDLAVTGSVNQRGEVQAVGGVTEKIEGFFDCCQLNGLSGDQGVVFPVANIDNVLLREDVVAAVGEGRFHLYPVKNVDAALEVLTGCSAGSPMEPETLNCAVDDSLEALARRIQQFMQTGQRPA
ncbi:MAG: AAA family ATPase [Deltaproteobacteria bacterium]|nr:AAA family ATPase [Deltaproteobacteria bacterium]MBW2417507.1 AAA family ATPase [Deltaproteobacteria bacterium]